MCGHVCVSPARAIISRAAPNLRVLGIPDVLSMSILSFVATHCTHLRNLSFTDDGLFLYARSSTKESLKDVLKLPHLRTLTVQTPTGDLINELTDCDTKLSHVNFYDAIEANIPQLVKFVQRRRHELQSFLVTFGILDYDSAVNMYSSSCANSVEVMNASTSQVPRYILSDLLISTVAHYLKRIPFRCLYVSVLDDDMRFGRCDVARQRPRHCLVRTGMRPRCTSFHDSSPDMRDMDVQRPVCRASIFNIDPDVRHLNNFSKFIEPPLPNDSLYSLWYSPCATIRFDAEHFPTTSLAASATTRSPSALIGSSPNNNSTNGPRSKMLPSSLSSPASLATPPSASASPTQIQKRTESKLTPSRHGQGIQASDVVCTQLRLLVTQSCECDLWRFDSLPCLHSIEVTPMCTEVLREEEARERAIRIVRRAVMSLRRLHVTIFDKHWLHEHTFDIVRDVLENAPKISMLDFSTTFIVMAAEERKLLSILSQAAAVKVLHIGCCSHMTSMMSWSSGASTSSATGAGAGAAGGGSVGGGTGDGVTGGTGASGLAAPSECFSNVCLSRFVAVVPRLLKLVARWCENIESIDLHVENHSLDIGREVEAQQFINVCRRAVKAVDEFSCTMPNVGVTTFVRQLVSWGEEAARRSAIHSCSSTKV